MKQIHQKLPLNSPHHQILSHPKTQDERIRFLEERNRKKDAQNRNYEIIIRYLLIHD